MQFDDKLNYSAMQSENELSVSPTVPAELFGEIDIWFDWDFDVSAVGDVLGLVPYEADRQSNMRVNPISGKLNPGYWTYRTERIKDYYCETVIKRLQDTIEKHLPEFQAILGNYQPCGVLIRVFAEIGAEDDYPSLSISPAFAGLMSRLNASFEYIQDNYY